MGKLHLKKAYFKTGEILINLFYCYNLPKIEINTPL